MITFRMPRASAPSVPGRSRSHRSAWAASSVFRGSMTMNLVPCRAQRLGCHWSSPSAPLTVGSAPHTTMHRGSCSP